MKLKNAALILSFPLVAIMLMGGTKTKSSNRNTNNNNNNKNNKNENAYKPGSGESVKGWKEEDLSKAKDAGKPFCIYIYDSDDKTNTRAKLLESTEALGSVDVRSKLPNFTSAKFKADDKDFKGWPAQWFSDAKNGAALVIASSDMAQITIFDKNTPKESITPAAIAAVMDNVLKYETARKAAVEQQKKEAKAGAEEKKK